VIGFVLTIFCRILQSAIALFNLFSAFRKVKIAVYMGEEENGRIQLSEEQFRDEMSEPRDSMSSEV
jgi:mannose/fructose/N-acetylgalactosamine-specific phosphotransferase system component IIC